ncbi:unnamed protein product [Lactuca saligna]|uniref:Uncharacterized protein n=1 Tax=Lactuca saligna TaxID=75948 RepID=A0AA35ZH54_LACSI|nr:unnamed protein product [Lactuca saligna]
MIESRFRSVVQDRYSDIMSEYRHESSNRARAVRHNIPNIDNDFAIMHDFEPITFNEDVRKDFCKVNEGMIESRFRSVVQDRYSDIMSEYRHESANRAQAVHHNIPNIDNDFAIMHDFEPITFNEDVWKAFCKVWELEQAHAELARQNGEMAERQAQMEKQMAEMVEFIRRYDTNNHPDNPSNPSNAP